MFSAVYSAQNLLFTILHSFAESSVGKMVIPTYTTSTVAGDTSSVSSSQNAIPEWLGSHKVECVL